MVKQILEKIEKDKLLHFVAGSLIYASTSWFLGYYFRDKISFEKYGLEFRGGWELQEGLVWIVSRFDYTWFNIFDLKGTDER